MLVPYIFACGIGKFGTANATTAAVTLVAVSTQSGTANGRLLMPKPIINTNTSGGGLVFLIPPLSAINFGYTSCDS